jgi:hypothetical protein
VKNRFQSLLSNGSTCRRYIWVSTRTHRTNLSLGYNAIISINIRTASSRLRGTTQALYVLTKFQVGLATFHNVILQSKHRSI